MENIATAWPAVEEFLKQNWWLVVLLQVWQVAWKIPALWKSARSNHMVWFLVFVFVNFLAIPEIIYIFVINKGKQSETG